MQKRVAEMFAGVGGFRVGLESLVSAAGGHQGYCRYSDMLWSCVIPAPSIRKQ